MGRRRACRVASPLVMATRDSCVRLSPVRLASHSCLRLDPLPPASHGGSATREDERLPRRLLRLRCAPPSAMCTKATKGCGTNQGFQWRFQWRFRWFAPQPVARAQRSGQGGIRNFRRRSRWKSVIRRRGLQGRGSVSRSIGPRNTNKHQSKQRLRHEPRIPMEIPMVRAAASCARSKKRTGRDSNPRYRDYPIQQFSKLSPSASRAPVRGEAHYTHSDARAAPLPRA